MMEAVGRNQAIDLKPVQIFANQWIGFFYMITAFSVKGLNRMSCGFYCAQ